MDAYFWNEGDCRGMEAATTGGRGFCHFEFRMIAASQFLSFFMLLSQFGGSSAFSASFKPTERNTRLFMAEGDDSKSVVPKEAGIEPGSHDELMYTLGVNLARQLGDVRPLVESSEELTYVAKGILDTVVGRLDDDSQRTILSKRGKELDALIVERATALREKLEKAGRDMLENMKSADGVRELEGGVLLHVLEHGPDGEGKGARPTKGSTVSIHYHELCENLLLTFPPPQTGTLPDGTVFDSTMGKDPIKIPLANVIPGWRLGVLQMHEGETAMLGIPPDQAYGAEGTPDGRIPGGSTLFFKIQLVEILTGGIGGEAKLFGADGGELGKKKDGAGLLGVDGKPL
eukprot:scaffold1319_cov126-Cylindrotheca_fusiformis.AAC.38